MEKALIDRFWKKVAIIPEHPCWEWIGYKNRKYGYINVHGFMMRAHRFSWELHNGPILNGLFVLHKCDNPGCVNPNHLFLGTQQDNMRDRQQKNRHLTCGWNQRLTEADVIEIIRLFKEENKTKAEIGRIFNYDRGNIRRILKGHIWKRLKSLL